MSSSKKNVFIRESSGLVKQFGMMDAAGKVANVMLPLAAFYTLLWAPTIPGANNFGIAAIIASFFAIPPLFVYMRLSELIPRSSGEYIYISRFINPIMGSIQGVTTIIGMTMFAASLIIELTVIAGLIPMLQLFGLAFRSQNLINLSNVIGSSPYYLFAVSELFVLIYSLIISINNKVLSKVVLLSLIGGQIIGSAIVSFIFIYLGRSSFVKGFNSLSQVFGSSQNYQFISLHGEALVSQFSVLGTLVMAVLLWLWILAWFIGPSYFAGEFKGGKSTIRKGMILGWSVGALFLILLSYGSQEALGLSFFDYAALNGWGNIPINFDEGFVIWAGIMVLNNPVLLVILGITGFLAEFGINAILMALGTRVMLAMSFDRLLPEFLAKVTSKGIPIWSSTIISLLTGMWVFAQTIGGFNITPIGIIVLVVMYQMVPAVASGAFIAFRRKISLNERERKTLAIASIIAAVDLLASAILVLVYGFINSSYGEILFAGSSVDTLGTLIAVPLIGITQYFTMKKIREKEGLNIDLVFNEIPPE